MHFTELLIWFHGPWRSTNLISSRCICTSDSASFPRAHGFMAAKPEQGHKRPRDRPQLSAASALWMPPLGWKISLLELLLFSNSRCQFFLREKTESIQICKQKDTAHSVGPLPCSSALHGQSCPVQHPARLRTAVGAQGTGTEECSTSASLPPLQCSGIVFPWSTDLLAVATKINAYIRAKMPTLHKYQLFLFSFY